MKKKKKKTCVPLVTERSAINHNWHWLLHTAQEEFINRDITFNTLNWTVETLTLGATREEQRVSDYVLDIRFGGVFKCPINCSQGIIRKYRGSVLWYRKDDIIFFILPVFNIEDSVCSHFNSCHALLFFPPSLVWQPLMLKWNELVMCFAKLFPTEKEEEK